MKLKPMSYFEENIPLPVKYITPPKTIEPADVQTIATVLLRRNRKLLEQPGKPQLEALTLLTYAFQRPLSEKEAKRAIALVALIKAKQ